MRTWCAQRFQTPKVPRSLIQDDLQPRLSSQCSHALLSSASSHCLLHLNCLSELHSAALLKHEVAQYCDTCHAVVTLYTCLVAWQQNVLYLTVQTGPATALQLQLLVGVADLAQIVPHRQKPGVGTRGGFDGPRQGPDGAKHQPAQWYRERVPCSLTHQMRHGKGPARRKMTMCRCIMSPCASGSPRLEALGDLTLQTPSGFSGTL